MRFLNIFLVPLSLIPFAAALDPLSQNCPILGPVLPAPKSPESSLAVTTAADAFPQVLKDAINAGTFDGQNTSFAINVFSASSNKTLFNYHYEAPGLNGSIPSGKLNDDTVFRIGSISKLFTAYALITLEGYPVLSEPITKYVLELRGQTGDTIDHVQWDDTTIGALASHLAGVGRGYGADLMDEDLPFAQLGLPVLTNASRPICGIDPGLTVCNRSEFFQGISSLYPVVPAFHTPIYSNLGYSVLGYALESMTNQTFQDALSQIILQPLNLSRTTTVPPVNDTNIIIPGGPNASISSLFGVDAGYENAPGGVFSTTSDLTALGQSILQSALLSSSVTRNWMKPMTHTSDLQGSVGAPWEIERLQVPLSNSTNDTRVVDLYTKNGDTGVYSAHLGLSVDHNFGISILTAGPNASPVRNMLETLVATQFVPALEDAAREEALRNFAGTYTSANATDNSSITLTLDAERPGLGISSWTNNGVDVLASATTLYGVTAGSNKTLSARLYPTTLASGDEISFRAVFEVLPYDPPVGLISDSCSTWVGVDATTYGGIGVDEFVFRVGSNGTAVSPRVVRKWLYRE